MGRRRIQHQHPWIRRGDSPERAVDVGAVKERERRRVGHQKLTLGVPQIADEFLAPVSRIGPYQHSPGQGRRLQPEDELRHVLEEDGHMERAR
jgi:hypothetical protein